jgi:hypothetical protein
LNHHSIMLAEPLRVQTVKTYFTFCQFAFLLNWLRKIRFLRNLNSNTDTTNEHEKMAGKLVNKPNISKYLSDDLVSLMCISFTRCTVDKSQGGTYRFFLNQDSLG